MTDTRSRSNTICALSNDWGDELDDDPSIKLIASSDTDSDCGINKKPFSRVSTQKNSIMSASPWRYEKRGSISSASSTGTSKKTPTNKRRLSNVGLKYKKTYLMKNSPYKTISMKKNPSNLPRSKWSTTGKKNNSKYSWTGIFNEKHAKRSIFSYGNESFSNEEKYDETIIDTLTRSSSPVDAKFYYSSDSETEARVFSLKNRSGNCSTFRQTDDTLCDESNGFYGQSIVDPDIGENSDRGNCRKTFFLDNPRNSQDHSSCDDNSSTTNENSINLIKKSSVNSNERRSSIFGIDLLNKTRYCTSESTLRASSDSSKSSISRNSIVRRTSVRDMRIISQSIELDDEVFEIEAQSDSPVFKSTADLWVDDEITKNDTVSEKTEKSTINKCEKRRNSTIIRSLGNIFLTLVKNVILFSILPTAYIAFFIYVQTRDDTDRDLY